MNKKELTMYKELKVKEFLEKKYPTLIFTVEIIPRIAVNVKVLSAIEGEIEKHEKSLQADINMLSILN